MKRNYIYLSTLMLILLLPLNSFAQGPEGSFHSGEDNITYEEYLKKNSASLTGSNKKLAAIREKVHLIQKQLRSGKISESQARKRLRSLAKEELSILEDPEFKILNKINMAIYSSKNLK